MPQRSLIQGFLSSQLLHTRWIWWGMKTCIHSVHVFLTWSTSVHWLQSWKIVFKKFCCIVRDNGDRFLIIWRQTLLANCPQCGVCSTKESSRDLSSCFWESSCRRITWVEKPELAHSFSLPHNVPMLWKWQGRISRARCILPLLWRRSCARSRGRSGQGSLGLMRKPRKTAEFSYFSCYVEYGYPWVATFLQSFSCRINYSS